MLCPICKKIQKSRACPHTKEEVEAHKERQRILESFRDEISEIIGDTLYSVIRDVVQQELAAVKPIVDPVRLDQMVYDFGHQRRSSGTLD